jgi:hypothetical protein
MPRLVPGGISERIDRSTFPRRRSTFEESQQIKPTQKVLFKQLSKVNALFFN